MTGTRLVLWALDGALVPDGPFNDEVRRHVCSQLLGRPCEQLAPAAGRTVPQIIRETLRLNGASEDSLDELTAQAGPLLAAALRERRTDIVTAGRVPGSAEAIVAIRLRRDAQQAVISGDVEDAATTKVTAFEFERFIDALELSGYGSDAADYGALVNAAHEKYKAKYGTDQEPSRTVVVGTTREDVIAAIKVGAGVVAVAGDPDREQDLRAAGAAHVLSGLSDTPAVLEAIYAA